MNVSEVVRLCVLTLSSAAACAASARTGAFSIVDYGATTNGASCTAARCTAKPFLPAPTVKGAENPRLESHWKGKKVAFLGDSITDPRHVGCKRNYWEFLASTLGVDAHVYARSGAHMERSRA